MRKKTVWSVCIFVSVFLCCILYFRPISLSDKDFENSSTLVQINHFDIQNGEPCINTENYGTITAAQKEDLLRLIQEYSYRRTLKTYVSDGAMVDLGDTVSYLYLYDKDTLVKSIFVSDSGQVSVNDRLYQMKNAEQFNERLEDIFK